MKFLCPQCKAKYRIADEKLAQRASSRMKCRKCGHVIDIHAATVPDSMFPPPGEDEPDEDAPRRSVPRVAAAPSALRPASASKRGAPAPKRAAAVVPPRRGVGGAAVAEKTISLDEERPGAMPIAEPPETEPAATKPRAAPPPRNDFDEDQPTRIHDGGALSAAFSSVDGASAVAPPGQDEWYVGIDGNPVGPIGMSDLRERAASGKATLDSLVWKEGFEEWKPLRDFPELASLVSDAARAKEDPKAAPASSPLEPQRVSRAISVSESPGEILEKVGAKPVRSGSHPAAWAAIVVALGLGGTIGVVLQKPEKEQIVKYVEVPASAKVEQAPVAGDPTMLEEANVSGTATKKTGTVAQKTEAPPAPATTGKTGLSLGGLGANNPSGPTGSGSDTAAPSNAAGGQLDSAAIQRTVGNFTSSVRRGCWDSALAGRAPDAPSSARVMVTVTISPSGSVDSVTSSGDPKGYPSLSRCIESKVRGWKFPRSSAPTTANIPFVFAAQ